MGYNTFIFLKKYEERLDDFNNILSNNLKACEIVKGWSDYLELAIEPVGWKAIWRISREICVDFNITFPCTVIVVVKQVNVKELSSTVDVQEVDNDNIDLPETVADVPLIELYPTKEQDNACALAIYETANLIDSLRFFYHNLWMPWDLEFDEEESWIDCHLEGRLQLHFSMVDLQVPEELIYEVRKLVAEGRKTLRSMETLQGSEMEAELSADNLLEITKLHNRLSQLRNAYAIYEKPNLLKAVVERQKNTKDVKPATTVVLSSATPRQLSKLAEHLATTAKPVRLVPTLQEALVKSCSGGSVYVTQGEHSLHDLASLNTGGSITGLEAEVVITGDQSGEDCASLDLLKGNLALTQLTLRLLSSWNIVKVRPSTECNLSDVTLLGSPVTDGVDVYPGATLTATNCAFSNCQTALVCYPDSIVRLSGCTFTGNRIAIELRGVCQFSMNDCTISGSACAVKVALATPLHKEYLHSPTSPCLNSIPQVKESGTVYTNNKANILFLNADECSNGVCMDVGLEDKVAECSF